jgi:hypothetical protein
LPEKNIFSDGLPGRFQTENVLFIPINKIATTRPHPKVILRRLTGYLKELLIA